MKINNNSEILELHSGWLTIFEIWFKLERVIFLGFYPQHIFLFNCSTNGAVKGRDNCFDFNLRFLGFFFGYTDYAYYRYKKDKKC